MKESKQNMINLQLIVRGITDGSVIQAFSEIDKEDFLPYQYRRQAYTDIEMITFSSNRSVLRCFVLAKIAEYARALQPASVLIVGDFLGYTTSIFAKLFRSCTSSPISNSELDNLKKVLPEGVSLQLFEHIILKKQDKFDFVFFDSGVYQNSTIKNALNLLTENGFIIHFAKKESAGFSEKQFEFKNIAVKQVAKNQTNDIFNMNLLFSNSIIALA